MPNPLTPTVQETTQRTVDAIVEGMKNAQRKIDLIPIGQDASEFENVRADLRNELVKIRNKTITDLNDSPDLDQIVRKLDDASTKAKKEAASLAEAAKKIADFTKFLESITNIVGGIIDIAI